MKSVLLTGASGFLGTHLLSDLAAAGIRIFAFSRQVRSNTAEVTWLQADISDEASLLKAEVVEALEGIDCIIHAAALYDLNAGHEELYRQNVLGTANLLHLARYLKKQPHFAHVSTIAIAGNSHHKFDEDTFDVGQSFPDSYASTKFASEQLVRSAADLASRSIYRLGILVGSTVDGAADRVDGPYVLQKIIKGLSPYAQQLQKLKFLPIPYHESTRLYIIPVDIASDLIVKLSQKTMERSGITTFHVTGGGRGVSVRRALQTILSHYDILVNPIPLPQFVMIPRLMRTLRIPANEGNYLYSKWTFSSKNIESELKGFRYPSWSQFSKRLMDYADQHLLKGKTKK